METRREKKNIFGLTDCGITFFSNLFLLPSGVYVNGVSTFSSCNVVLYIVGICGS